jgi:hypothetical protein
MEQTLVQIRPADADKKPTDTVLAEEVMDEKDLKSYYTWRDVPFAKATGLSPDQKFCLVLKNGTGSGTSARLAYDDGGGSGGINTKDGGTTWSYFDSIARLYYVYGKASTPAPPQTATRYYVTAVQVALRTGEELASRLVTTAQTLNIPELLSGLWEADFGSDPTLDHNGDGVDDWVAQGGGSFDGGDLSGGVWHASVKDPPLQTNPPNDFTGLTTVELRFRNTSVTGKGAAFGINVDWTGSNCAEILALLQLESDSTQTLRVQQRLDAVETQTLVTVAGLSDGFVDLRLLIDPALNTVNVRVNGKDCGTFACTLHLPEDNEHFATIEAIGTDAEFDSVSIRASE